ncbi:pyrroline-5-carboxylate reductase [Zavarzinia sp. CC-PAN008]|uniref:pyrroline-5-carboxylate reductase n=1 Tax=Zavarzinia sp. CC-PAN008 TaxID=3243332 RepID=UPI003F743877
MLDGWLARGLVPADVTVVEPGLQTLPTGVRHLADPSGLTTAAPPDAVILAVKPQVMDDVLPAYVGLAAARPVFISIAAGRTIASFERALGNDVAIVRAMPNLPARIGRGMTAAVANGNATAGQRALADVLLSASGDFAWLDDEGLIDPVTAVSGGGPAYVFLLAEVLAHAAVEAGIPRALAMQLARQTVTGAAALLEQSTDDPATLRKSVTSPKGTTERALAVLMASDGIGPLFEQAIAAATARSRELAT